MTSKYPRAFATPHAKRMSPRMADATAASAPTHTRQRLRETFADYRRSHDELDHLRHGIRREFDRTIAPKAHVHSTLVESIYNTLRKTFPDVAAWKQQFTRAHSHISAERIVKPKWVEGYLCPALGIDPAVYPYEEFMRVFVHGEHHRQVPGAHPVLHEHELVAKIVAQVEAWPALAAECAYFRREIEGVMNQAHATVQASHRSLKQKIEGRYYDDEYEESNRATHTAVNIPTEKILDIIHGRPSPRHRTTPARPPDPSAKPFNKRRELFRWDRGPGHNAPAPAQAPTHAAASRPRPRLRPIVPSPRQRKAPVPATDPGTVDGPTLDAYAFPGPCPPGAAQTPVSLGTPQSHRHVFTPDSLPPTPFRLVHVRGADEDEDDGAHRAHRHALERYEWQQLGSKIANRFMRRSNELPSDARTRVHHGVLGEQTVPTKLVSLQAGRQSDRPMSVRHRLHEAHAQLSGYPCHFGMCSSDIHHQLEQGADHHNQGLNDQHLAVILHGLKETKTVTTLQLQHNRFGPDGCHSLVSFLERNDSIHTLDLSSNTGIGAAGMRHFSRSSFGCLTSVNLSKCNLGNAGVAHLCEGLVQNHTIATLMLAHNGIGDRGARRLGDAIAHHPGLRDVVLKWNLIRNEGACAIARALRDPRVDVECLDLSYNAIGGGTGESNSALEFSQALFVNRKLLHLNLGHNRLNRHDLFLILRRVEQANNTCMVLHLEGNWHPGPDCKTHDGHARHQVILEDDPDAAEGRTGCAVFDRALAPRPPAVHGAVQFRGASLNAHASVHLEVDEATVHEDAGHDHAVHGFDSLLDPGTSMLFSRILGRSQMLHAMEWIECHRCWICAEASQFTFELDSLAEIGLTRVGGGWPDAEWWRAIEVWWTDASGRRRHGKANSVVGEAKGVFRHTAMVIPGKVHFMFRDGTLPLDQCSVSARLERSIYTPAQTERRREAAISLQRAYRQAKGLPRYVSPPSANGAFHISTQQAVEGTTREELVFSMLSFANFGIAKARHESLVPDSTFIRRRSVAKKKAWTKAASAFKRVLCDNDGWMARCLKVDWRSLEMAKIVRDEADQQAVYTLALGHYHTVVALFKFYCTDTYDMVTTEELFCMSKLQFLGLLEDAGLLHDKLCTADRGAFERVYLGSLLSKTHQKLPGLYRPQFLGALVRVASIAFSEETTRAGAFTRLLKAILSTIHVLDYDQFRTKYLFVRESDVEIGFYIPVLRKLYSKHAVVNIETNEQNVLYFDGFLETLKYFHADELMDKREIGRTFVRSQTTLVGSQEDGVTPKRFMRFHEWLDAMCWASFLSTIKEERNREDYCYLQRHVEVLPLAWFVDGMHQLLKEGETSHRRSTIQFTYLAKVKALVHKMRRRVIGTLQEHREEELQELHAAKLQDLQRRGSSDGVVVHVK